MNEELIIRINDEVNNQIRYMTDMEQYGVSEKWVVSPSSNRGDCEDYALTKLSRLVRAGIPSARCNIYVVYIVSGDGAGQNHAVLVIDRRWVLDNMTSEIRHIRDCPFVILRRH